MKENGKMNLTLFSVFQMVFQYFMISTLSFICIKEFTVKKMEDKNGRVLILETTFNAI